jgi:geranyl-CoA carboxylase alpha subunit
VEFLLDGDGAFWFIEANARLQVEHPVTEAITGLDLVEWQLRVAAGEPLTLRQEEIRFDGHAIEARLCAEDPARDFLPQSGRLALWQPAAGARVDHALESGIEITPYYDSLLAKLVAHGRTRDAAREKLAAALDATLALGVTTNKSYLAAVLRDAQFASAGATTSFLGERLAGWKPPPSDDPFARRLYASACAAAAGYGEWSGWSNMGRTALPSAPCVLDGATLHFALDGHSFSWRDTTMDPPGRRAAGPIADSLTAPMNARVVAVHARAGDAVEAGQPLVVLEAMKMEHTLVAPAALRVRAVHVSKGAQVAPGALLVEFGAGG